MTDRSDPRPGTSRRRPAGVVLEPVARAMQYLQRAAVLEPGRGPRRKTAAPEIPGEIAPARPSMWVVFAVALVVPVGVAGLLALVRDELGAAASLVMVLPVLAVSAVAGTRAGAVAAAAGAGAYAVLLTEPYGRFTIADPDDVIESVALLVIGLVVGTLSDRSRRERTVTQARGRELDAVTRFLHDVSTSVDAQQRAGAAERAIADLLSARACDWRPGYHGTVGAVLRADGTLTTGTSAPAVGPGSEVLPAAVEIPVGSGVTELGRFVVRTDPAAAVSIEERRAAVAVASLLAALDR